MINLWAVETSLQAFMKRTADEGGFVDVADGLMQVIIWLRDNAPDTLRVSYTYVSGSTAIQFRLGDAGRYTNVSTFELHIPVMTNFMKFDHTSAAV